MGTPGKAAASHAAYASPTPRVITHSRSGPEALDTIDSCTSRPPMPDAELLNTWAMTRSGWSRA